MDLFWYLEIDCGGSIYTPEMGLHYESGLTRGGHFGGMG